jgi:hypothetical protein
MIIMRIPQQVSERMKEAPAQALRAVFSGIGQVLLVADRIRSSRTADPARAHPAATKPPGQGAPAAPKEETRWRSLDETGNVRLLSEEDAPAGAEPATAAPAPGPKAATAATSPRAEPATAKPAVPEPPGDIQPATAAQPPAVPEPPGDIQPATAAQPPAIPEPPGDIQPATAAQPPAVPEPPGEIQPATAAQPPAAPKPAASKSALARKPAAASKQTTPRRPAAAAKAGADQVALPVPNYDDLSVPSLRARLRNLDAYQVGALLDYEKAHASRADVLTMYERRIAKLQSDRA